MRKQEKTYVSISKEERGYFLFFQGSDRDNSGILRPKIGGVMGDDFGEVIKGLKWILKDNRGDSFIFDSKNSYGVGSEEELIIRRFIGRSNRGFL
ncbi:MAG: hypothetical protein KJ721_00640 [Nanoarchaeota archaeon]|nr:hypothetical protein [Nanoarchaeota archaeon]